MIEFKSTVLKRVELNALLLKVNEKAWYLIEIGSAWLETESVLDRLLLEHEKHKVDVRLEKGSMPDRLTKDSTSKIALLTFSKG